jgi:hypothetical protein
MNSAQVNRQIAAGPANAAGIFDAMWRPAGIAYLFVMLIGLAMGLWPGTVTGSVNPYWPAQVPAVQTLTIAQAAFCLLIYPVLAVFRSQRPSGWRFWPEAAVETLFWTAISVLFYVPAVWLSGSSPLDAVAAGIYVLTLWPMAWVCGAWLASDGPGRSVALLISILAAIGLPWLWYVSAEFFYGAGWTDTLWSLSPVTRAWDVAAPGAGGQGGEPFWAWAIWPVFAAVIFATRLVFCRRSDETR